MRCRFRSETKHAHCIMGRVAHFCAGIPQRLRIVGRETNWGCPTSRAVREVGLPTADCKDCSADVWVGGTREPVVPQFPARGFGGRTLPRSWSRSFRRWRVPHPCAFFAQGWDSTDPAPGRATRLQVDLVQVLLQWIGRPTLRAAADEDGLIMRPVHLSVDDGPEPLYCSCARNQKPGPPAHHVSR